MLCIALFLGASLDYHHFMYYLLIDQLFYIIFKLVTRPAPELH